MTNHTITPEIQSWATDREVINRAEAARLLGADPHTIDRVSRTALFRRCALAVES